MVHWFQNSPCSLLVQQRMLRLKSMQNSFTQGRQIRDIKSLTLKRRGIGFWGCLQMMNVIPRISRSSSPATVVNTGSTENRWLGQWASIKHRIVNKRAARVKLKENRSNSRSQICWDLGSHPTPKFPPSRRATMFPRLLIICQRHTSCQFQNTTKEKTHTAHQAVRHIHRQCGQISEQGWC